MVALTATRLKRFLRELENAPEFTGVDSALKTPTAN